VYVLRSSLALKAKNKIVVSTLLFNGAPNSNYKARLVGGDASLLSRNVCVASFVSTTVNVFVSSLSMERNPFPAKNHTQRSYRVYISPTM